MTRKIISLHGPNANWAICDDGTVWFWQFTGISGRWQRWDRPPIPQPDPGPDVIPEPTLPKPLNPQQQATPGYSSSRKNPR